jgi:hypothetical protein
MAQLQPLRGFKLEMSLNEALNRFHDRPSIIPRPDALSVRSIEIGLTRQQDERGSTSLNKLSLKFLNDNLYQIEATYSLGKEWATRPMSEFADSLSRGLGINAGWTVESDNQLKLNCGEMKFTLDIDEESLASLPQSTSIPVAVAYFTLTDSTRAAQLKSRRDSLRQKERQREAEQRREFKPR